MFSKKTVIATLAAARLFGAAVLTLDVDIRVRLVTLSEGVVTELPSQGAGYSPVYTNVTPREAGLIRGRYHHARAGV